MGAYIKRIFTVRQLSFKINKPCSWLPMYNVRIQPNEECQDHEKYPIFSDRPSYKKALGNKKVSF